MKKTACERGEHMGNTIDNVRFNFLYIDTYSFGKNWIFAETVIPYNMLRFIKSGKGTFFIDDEEIEVEKGQIVYISKGSKLSCYAQTDKFSFVSIRFTTTVFFEGGDFLSDYYGVPKCLSCAECEKYFDLIYECVKKEDSARMYFIRGYLELLIGTLISCVEKNPELQENICKTSEEYNLKRIQKKIKKIKNEIDPRIQGVIDYILLHPAEKYTPQRMADMANLSKQRFSSLFKKQVGKSPMVYIKELKMTTAARKLLVSSSSVSDIAYEVGYEDPNYFIREFKTCFGYTPNQYRQAAKE